MSPSRRVTLTRVRSAATSHVSRCNGTSRAAFPRTSSGTQPVTWRCGSLQPCSSSARSGTRTRTPPTYSRHMESCGATAISGSPRHGALRYTGTSSRSGSSASRRASLPPRQLARGPASSLTGRETGGPAHLTVFLAGRIDAARRLGVRAECCNAAWPCPDCADLLVEPLGRAEAPTYSVDAGKVFLRG